MPRALPLAALAAVAALALALPAPASAAEAVAGQLIVGFRPGTPQATQDALLARAGGTLRRGLGFIDAASIRPRPGVSLGVLRRALSRSRHVRYVERDFVLRASVTPDDPQFDLQYGLSQPSGEDVSATTAWNDDTKCAKIATLDTGAQTDHPDLKDNLVANAKEIPSNGKDDDKNGYVDDYYGLNVIEGKGNGEDDNGHGTHVAGIIGAVGNNLTGIAGVCWKASIVPVKFMNSKGKGATSDAVTGIKYAVKRGVKVINGSFGSSAKSDSLEDAVQYAKEKGVLLVVAAGNDGENIDKDPTYPASYGDGNILAVAATTAEDELADFSNYGPDSVDVAAPGDQIRSTYLGSAYKYLSGTSMASPLVAGSAALLRTANPDATFSQLRTALRKEVDKPSALKGKVVYDGRLNLQKALQYITGL